MAIKTFQRDCNTGWGEGEVVKGKVTVKLEGKGFKKLVIDSWLMPYIRLIIVNLRVDSYFARSSVFLLSVFIRILM